MSKIKHNNYRKVLSVENTKYTSGQVTVDVKIVLWCIPLSTTSRTIKTDHIMYSVYINRKTKFYGVNGWMPRKAVSINLKNPMKSKFFESLSPERTRNNAFSEAWQDFRATLTGLTGVVSWFNKSSGEGFVKCTQTGELSPIYACNLPQARSGYPETACVFYTEGQEINFKYSDHFVIPETIPHFDKEKWDKLDQSRLAFKKNIETGKFMNGLFS